MHYISYSSPILYDRPYSKYHYSGNMKGDGQRPSLSGAYFETRLFRIFGVLEKLIW